MSTAHTQDGRAGVVSDTLADKPNALHIQSPPGAAWSTINAAEAVPGVMTPLTASAWGPACEMCIRESFFAIGALDKQRRKISSDPQTCVTAPFYGRMAVRVDFLCQIGDLVPGQNGGSVARDVFGFVPPGYVSKPSYKRLPVVATRYPRTLLGISKLVRAQRVATESWWRRETAATAGLNLADAQRRLSQAVNRFQRMIADHSTLIVCAIQPAYEQLAKLAATAGADPSALVRGHGAHEENVVLEDMWAVSRDRMTLEEFLVRHGYHGPSEGEAINTSWREDPTPVTRTVERYRAMPDAQAPFADRAQWASESREAQCALMAAADGPLGRLKARLILSLARRYVPMRGVGKVTYVQSIDIVRATARHIGKLLTDAGRLDEPDDAFYLTDAELGGRPVSDPRFDLKPVVAERRSQRDRYLGLELPNVWIGQPEPTPARAGDYADTERLTGIGASPGTVTGRAVVVLDPSDAEVTDGDILVAYTTDPAWVSLMFLAEALVVDIGGLMSHAAVIARELGIPCVMNSGIGTKALHTGDTIHVDGSAGTVDIVNHCEGEG
jgi:pyruvate,water dikinase